MRLHHPEFPDRRAFFVETDARLSVYAQWGDRMAEDLRHEVTHGYLHSVVPNVPLWLDEGIAKFYEVPRGQRGLNRPLLDRLLARIEREHWQPDLRRLEQFPADVQHDPGRLRRGVGVGPFPDGVAAGVPRSCCAATWPICGATALPRRFPHAWPRCSTVPTRR